VSQDWNVEIDEQTLLKPRDPEVGQDLRAVKRVNLVDRLQFDEQNAADDEVRTKAHTSILAFIHQRQLDLSLERQIVLCELSRHARLVGRLEKARPKGTMNADGRANDLLCERTSEEHDPFQAKVAPVSNSEYLA